MKKLNYFISILYFSAAFFIAYQIDIARNESYLASTAAMLAVFATMRFNAALLLEVKK